MADDQYSHDFKFEVDGSFIRGECEFNSDEITTMRIVSEDISQPLKLDVLDQFVRWMRKNETIAHEHGGVSNIKIKKK